MNHPMIARHAAVSLLPVALVVAFHASAQSVPDLGEGNTTVSSVQATACTPPNPVGDRYDYCGWGVWSIETQHSTVIASLAEPASYLICREQVDPSEVNGYPVSFVVDGATVTGGTPGAALGQAPATCSLVAGKTIAIKGQVRPNKPVRGYYIRLGAKLFGNTVSWGMLKGGGAGGDRVLLAQLPAKRLLRVCFGNYNPVAPTPAYLREYRLWMDTGYIAETAGGAAVFNYGSCIDVEGAKVGAEPRWATGEPTNAFGRLTF